MLFVVTISITDLVMAVVKWLFSVDDRLEIQKFIIGRSNIMHIARIASMVKYQEVINHAAWCPVLDAPVNACSHA